jgi:putative flippase GtrA
MGIEILATRQRGTQGPPATRPLAAAGAASRSQILRFGAVGLITTVAYFGLYWLLRGLVAATVANLLALVATTLANTAANRRLTFGVKGREHLARAHAGGLLAFGLSLTMTTGSLSALQVLAPRAGAVAGLAALGLANALATVVRFALLRLAIYHPGRQSNQPPDISRRTAA